MCARPANPIQSLNDVLPMLEAALAPFNFARTGALFHRPSDHDSLHCVQAIAVAADHGYRAWSLHATVKYPALVEMLSEVRPFAYTRATAWDVPDFAGHVAGRLRLSDMPSAASMALPEGMRWGGDGRLWRRRSVDATTVAQTLAALALQVAQPQFDRRLTLGGLAQAADAPGYASSGVAGAWALAARLALGDLAGAERAFRAHPHALGRDADRLAAARDWLVGRGVPVGDVPWRQDEADRCDPWQRQPSLTGEWLR